MTKVLLVFPTTARAEREISAGLPENILACSYTSLMGMHADFVVFVTPDAGLNSPRAKGAYELAKTRVSPGGRVIVV